MIYVSRQDILPGTRNARTGWSHKMQIFRSDFGQYEEKKVGLYTLKSSSGLCVSVLEYGGIIQSILTPENGGFREVVLGYDTLEAYRRDTMAFGATIGPLADIVSGGRFELDGKAIVWEKNSGDCCIHSGTGGFHRQLWNAECTSDSLELYLHVPSNAFGYPSDMEVKVSFSLPEPETLQIQYTAKSSGAFAVSMTNHSYFHLGNAPSILNQYLKIRSPRLNPMDFTAFKPLLYKRGSKKSCVYPEGGLDHYYPVCGKGLRDAAWLYAPDSKLMLTCRTDAPGILVYTANDLNNISGRAGCIYHRYGAVCLETEAMPNGVNLPEERMYIVFEAGQTYKVCTQYSLRYIKNAEREIGLTEGGLSSSNK